MALCMILVSRALSPWSWLALLLAISLCIGMVRNWLVLLLLGDFGKVTLCHLTYLSSVWRNWPFLFPRRWVIGLGYLLSCLNIVLPTLISFFADDCLLFVKAKASEVCFFSQVVEDFCLASGFKVNMDKSHFMASRNGLRPKILKYSGITSMHHSLNFGKYLGFPLF